jgi:hypothetical protein
MLRRIVFALASALASLVLFVTAASAESCPNEQLRSENNSTALSDCRAYEMVSPAEKNGSDVYSEGGQVGPSSRAAPDGEAAMFSSTGAFAGAVESYGSIQYVARRSPAGWTTKPILPRSNSSSALSQAGVALMGISEQLTNFTFKAFDPPLTPEAKPDTNQLYTIDLQSGAITLLSPLGSLAPPTSFSPIFADASSDFSHIIFESSEPLTPEAPPVKSLYEWFAGRVTLVGILPEGAVATAGSWAGQPGGASDSNYTEDTISADGKRIFWTDASDDQLYMRENGGTAAARTVHVSAPFPDLGGVDPNAEPAQFEGATPSGSFVYFLSSERLTSDSTAVPGDLTDLYSYEVSTGTLTDLSVDPNPGESAGVVGLVGTSDDGSSVYFVAERPLVNGAPSDGGVYLWRAGVLRFVADASATGRSNFGTDPVKSSRVSPDGRYVLLLSQRPLTSYSTLSTACPVEGSPPGSRGPCEEFYRYDSQSRVIDCASCNPNGTPPRGSATTEVAGELAPSFTPFLVRSLDDAGRVYFDSPDALVPADTNDQMDVYEWDGQPHLISAGDTTEPSLFQDASADGSNVFFTTRDQLVSQDRDDNNDMYDARVGGGFARATASTPCASECQGQLGPAPQLLGPGSGSESLTGTGGDLTPVPAKAKPKTAAQLRAEKLRKALKSCKHNKRRQRRVACERAERKRFGPPHGAGHGETTQRRK